MADQSLVESKVAASKQLVEALLGAKEPLVAAYWEWQEDAAGWIFLLVPSSLSDKVAFTHRVSSLLVGEPFRFIFSVSDVFVESRALDRAYALGGYIRAASYVGRPLGKIFTGGQYFEDVVPIYFSPKLLPHLKVAS